jgi:hypothetical protein
MTDNQVPVLQKVWAYLQMERCWENGPGATSAGPLLMNFFYLVISTGAPDCSSMARTNFSQLIRLARPLEFAFFTA